MSISFPLGRQELGLSKVEKRRQFLDKIKEFNWPLPEGYKAASGIKCAMSPDRATPLPQRASNDALRGKGTRPINSAISGHCLSSTAKEPTNGDRILSIFG